jgi:hypothetical protein
MIFSSTLDVRLTAWPLRFPLAWCFGLSYGTDCAPFLGKLFGGIHYNDVSKLSKALGGWIHVITLFYYFEGYSNQYNHFDNAVFNYD